MLSFYAPNENFAMYQKSQAEKLPGWQSMSSWHHQNLQYIVEVFSTCILSYAPQNFAKRERCLSGADTLSNIKGGGGASLLF